MALRYPILLAHGMGWRDDRFIGYWGRIPRILTEQGERVYLSRQDSNGSIEGNAGQMKKSLSAALEDSGTEKVNIIAHSKGGLEARYLISSLDCREKVASLTTLSTPHNGSVTVDALMKHLRPAIRLGCKAADIYFKIAGDKQPDTYSAVCSFETENAERFNIENPDLPEVYYQSYAFVMKGCLSDITMLIPWLTVNCFEGENDGLLSPSAVIRGEFRGVCKGSGKRGISHCDEIDMRRRGFPLTISEKSNSVKCTDNFADITELYIKIVRDLTEKGF